MQFRILSIDLKFSNFLGGIFSIEEKKIIRDEE